MGLPQNAVFRLQLSEKLPAYLATSLSVSLIRLLRHF